MVTNIAIDGPAGAGKSTIAKMAAKKLDFIEAAQFRDELVKLEDLLKTKKD